VECAPLLGRLFGRERVARIEGGVAKNDVADAVWAVAAWAVLSST
jgi:hypothetical protein